MRSVSASELEMKFDEFLAEVINGETIIIIDDKTEEPIAEFVPVTDAN